MQQNGASLAALIGSRICHDLINPIGAISNGLELFGMGGASPDGPEMTLIQQSCDNATARIRFFRIAFGSAGDTRPIAPAEAAQTLANHYAGTRILTDWQMETALPRDLTQLAYLGFSAWNPACRRAARSPSPVSVTTFRFSQTGRSCGACRPCLIC
ncbi:hypothetical protein [Marivita geojedonensis]|uniref:hypothetical protein n=1 Tax=Marivita geojedonensis TaxID=1123756 RepID=UPI000D492570|nr:hypothetical protein [Marivita geojedonensis]PRY75609.1 histidine phosphotransferase [Marivita geojedonensis]